MRNCDLADSPLASHRPNIAEAGDSLLDQCRQALRDAAIKGTLLVSDADEAITPILSAAPPIVEQASPLDVVIPVLQMIYRDRSEGYVRYRAIGLLRILSAEGRSFEEVGRENGVKRAVPHLYYREVQEGLRLPSRGDKSAESRAESTALATGRLRVFTAEDSFWPAQFTPPRSHAA